MIGSEDSIDLSLKNIWRSWFAFRRGKRATDEMHDFQYHLEKNLFKLFEDLNTGHYRHGGYRKFIVCDNKRREISVASVRDRVVHRLVYDHLVQIYDKTFIFDAWSCRKGKGLLGAIERTQEFMKYNAARSRTRRPRSRFSWVWKSDVSKFFDSVDHNVLLKILSRRIKDKTTFGLLKEIIVSYSGDIGGRVGIPIGNLTSQVFANIYLNELDRFVKHELKMRAYLRYGDDFIVLDDDLEKLKWVRGMVSCYLQNELQLQINPKSDRIMKVSEGLKFLGVRIWPSGRTPNRRIQKRIKSRLNVMNISSYAGLIKKHGNTKQTREFNWLVCARIK